MKKSAFVSDVIFAFAVSFLLSLCLFRYLQIGLWLSFFLALACGLLTAAAAVAILRVKRKHFFLKRSDEAQKEKLLLHLALLSDNEKTEFFLKFLSLNEHAQKFGQLRIFTKTAFYFLNFNLLPVNADDIAKYSRLKTGKQKILLCSKIEEPAFALCSRLSIQVKTGEEIYALLKKANALPESFLGEENADKKHKRRLRLWFSRRNSKRFLVAAALVLATSVLTPFSYYYWLFGASLLLASVFVRIFGYE